MVTEKKFRKAFILLSVLFFLIGFITVLVDALIPRLRELFTLTYFQAGMVQFAFFGAYFLLSIPASFILSRIGYKGGILLGLITLSLGCFLFYPAAIYRAFSIFMLSYFTLAAGMAILQVAINPYIAVLGSESTSSIRLTLSQAFNSLGTAIAPTVGALFILSDTIKTTDEINLLTANSREVYFQNEASAVQNPFLVLAFLTIFITVIFFFVRLPKIIIKSTEGSYLQALRQKNLILGVLGIFCYVGAEVAIGSYLVNYFIDMNLAELIRANGFTNSIAKGLLNSELTLTNPKAIVGVFVTFYWTGAMVGRFLGFFLMKFINPGKTISIFASIAILLILVSINTNGLISMWSMLAVGLFNSIMFPTIFTLALNGIGRLKPFGSGLLCSAIVGGAIIPPIFGYLTDSYGFKLAFIFILLCYAYILFFGWKNKKHIQS